MAELMKGLGARWGVGGVTFTAGIVSSTNGQQIQSLNVNLTSDTQEVRNNIGEVVGKVYYNGRKELSLSVIPSHGSTKAGGKASVDAHMLTPGTTIRLVDTDGTTIDGTFSGDFNLVSSRMGLTNTGYAVVDIELESFVDNNMTITVT